MELTIETLLGSMDLTYDSLSDDELHEMYDDMLDECCTCESCGKGGSDLKETDPIAYRCGFNDWLDAEVLDGSIGEIDDEYFTDEQKDELKDAIISEIEDLF